MIQQLKATYSDGVFKPTSPVDLDDGAQVVIEVSQESHVSNEFTGLEASAGGWKGIVDCEQLIDDIYQSRATESRGQALPELE